MKTLKEALSMNEALFNKKNLDNKHKKELSLRSNIHVNSTLSIEISNDKASFNYVGIHYGMNYNITIVISIEDAKSVIKDLGIKHYKSGKKVYDVYYNKKNYIYCDSSGKEIIMGNCNHPYDVVFHLDEKQIEELKSYLNENSQRSSI